MKDTHIVNFIGIEYICEEFLMMWGNVIYGN